MLKAIIPECYVDTCLIEVLLGVEKYKEGVNHGKGNSTVANKMKDKFARNFALGVIDSDKNKKPIKYLEEFSIINDSVKDWNVLLRHKDHNTHHYFIQICPESEFWICKVGRDLGLNLLNDYQLPATPKGLMDVTKRVNVRSDARLVMLFRDIKLKAQELHYEPVLKLISWLTELLEKTYNADLSKLEE